MSTIIRVKRKLNEEQAVDDRIVLNIKKQKTDENIKEKSPQNEKTVLKFAGTVDQAANTEENILKLTKSEAEKIVSRKTVTASRLQKRLSENKEKAQKNRFTVLNYTRSTSAFEEEASSNEFTIVDVQKENLEPNTEKASAAAASSAEPSEYVYDIYVAEKTPEILNSKSIDINNLSILDYNDYLYSCPRLMPDSDSSADEADEDSNDENYYKNDYPDEDELSNDDDDESVGEREMRRAMQNFDMENDLSSDDDKEGFIYSLDAEGIEFEDDLDYFEVTRHPYDEFMKRARRQMEEEEESEEAGDYCSSDD